MVKMFNVQLFAGLDDVITANAAAFEGSDIKDQYGKITAKLGELGYDVLLNNKKQAEFIPSSRLNEVVSQRDSFKTKVEEQNALLATMQKEAGTSEALKTQIQGLMDQNSALLKDIESTKIHTEIMLAAKDAINSKDILAFVDMNNIKVNAKGEVLGIDAEINRLKTEKPYLFDDGTGKKKKAGMDDNGGNDDKLSGGMNAMIRRAAGRF